MDLYVAVCEDRHIDTTIRVFSKPEDAIQYCKRFVQDRSYDLEEELDEVMIEAGWIYNATYGIEGEGVRVEKVVLDSPE